jgi:hypothetical protein
MGLGFGPYLTYMVDLDEGIYDASLVRAGEVERYFVTFHYVSRAGLMCCAPFVGIADKFELLDRLWMTYLLFILL